jgi:anti-sigma-K factor RskA
VNAHEQAAAYVLGALDPAEAREFEAQLAGSPELEREVAELREVMGLLAHSAPSVPRDDDALRRRLSERIGGTTRPSRTPIPAWFGGLGLAAAAVLTLVVGVQAWRRSALESELAALRERVDSLSTQLGRRDSTLDQIFEPSTRLILLTASGERPPGVQLFVNRATRRVILHAFNLPPAQPGREYQLWFLGGAAPVPGGTFNSDVAGRALVTLDVPPGTPEVSGAAVTMEPAGGSPQPTSPILVSGTVAPR